VQARLDEPGTQLVRAGNLLALPWGGCQYEQLTLQEIAALSGVSIETKKNVRKQNRK